MFCSVQFANYFEHLRETIVPNEKNLLSSFIVSNNSLPQVFKIICKLNGTKHYQTIAAPFSDRIITEKLP